MLSSFFFPLSYIPFFFHLQRQCVNFYRCENRLPQKMTFHSRYDIQIFLGTYLITFQHKTPKKYILSALEGYPWRYVHFFHLKFTFSKHTYTQAKNRKSSLSDLRPRNSKNIFRSGVKVTYNHVRHVLEVFPAVCDTLRRFEKSRDKCNFFFFPRDKCNFFFFPYRITIVIFRKSTPEKQIQC